MELLTHPIRIGLACVFITVSLLVLFDKEIDQLCVNQMMRNGFELKESNQQCKK
jgi:hypothetical protein